MNSREAACLEDDDAPLPDDDVAAIFCGQRSRSNLQRLLTRFFESATRRTEANNTP